MRQVRILRSRAGAGRGHKSRGVKCLPVFFELIEFIESQRAGTQRKFPTEPDRRLGGTPAGKNIPGRRVKDAARKRDRSIPPANTGEEHTIEETRSIKHNGTGALAIH